MRLIVFAICYNQAELIPWFLRHYGSFADEISVWDDQSTDGSRELLDAHPQVRLRDWPHRTGMDEEAFLAHAYEWYPQAHPAFDWAMWVDMDEFVHAPDVRSVLAGCDGVEVARTKGYNMTGEGLPQDDGRSQIWELSPWGVVSPAHSKPVVFRPSARIRWTRGRHALESRNAVTEKPVLRLLHYRYLGGPYTAARNGRNFARRGMANGGQAAAWTRDPRHTGIHSAAWADSLKDCRWNAVGDPL